MTFRMAHKPTLRMFIIEDLRIKHPMFYINTVIKNESTSFSLAGLRDASPVPFVRLRGHSRMGLSPWELFSDTEDASDSITFKSIYTAVEKHETEQSVVRYLCYAYKLVICDRPTRLQAEDDLLIWNFCRVGFIPPTV
jgi:hypothetical protein